jgi:nucleotide-binding universal stress UspA family protein
VHRITRVVAAVDFSKPAREAFEYALALSRHHGAELIAIQAVPKTETFAHHGRARLTLTERLRHRAEQSGVAFSSRVQSGDPAEIVLLHARVLRPDVIVAGTHQRRGVARLRTGSVAERIAAAATVPVFVVPLRTHASVYAPFRHVVVAVDFSAGSTRAIERALGLMNHPADRITLVHVLPGSASSVPRHLYGYPLDARQDPWVRDAQQRLRDAVPATHTPAAAVHTHVMRGDAAMEIRQVAEDVGADLLIVGATARGVVSRALFGTTAARLLRVTPVPMLVVPDAGMPNADEAAIGRSRLEEIVAGAPMPGLFRPLDELDDDSAPHPMLLGGDVIGSAGFRREEITW